MLAAAIIAYPDIKRRSPISLPAQTPVYDVFKEIPKAAVTNVLGMPIYPLVYFKELIPYCSGLYKPAAAPSIKGEVAAPAEGIGVLVSFRFIKNAAVPQIFSMPLSASLTKTPDQELLPR